MAGGRGGADLMAHRVVIVGGGFGGLNAALGLRRAPVEVTLVDRRNFHLFQPLTYQVATGALSPGDIAYPLRSIFKRAKNVNVMLAEVAQIDLAAREVVLDHVDRVPAPPRLPYDTLIVAGGSRYSYFGHDEWRGLALEVKSLESALVARGRILSAFEAAEVESDPQARAAWLTFIVVGGGPTGVEMAGQIAELARDTLRRDFKSADPRHARVLLVEALDRLLTSFPPSLSKHAAHSLRGIGVEPMLERTVVAIQDGAVTTEQNGSQEILPSRTVIWAAGVTASPLASLLAEGAGVEVDRAGRVTVNRDLTLPGHPDVLALGDMVRIDPGDGAPQALPGLAPVAIQEGHYAARLVRDRLRNRTTKAFHYHDKGNLATIGRAAAVADIKGVKVSGLLAWLTWVVVHLWYLIGFENRVVVMVRWAISFVTHGRGARLITRAEGGGDGGSPEPPQQAGAQDADAKGALQAVIFDLDGVIVDSEGSWDRARRAVVAEAGGHWREDATRAMMGMSAPEWAHYMRSELAVDLPEEAINERVVNRLLDSYAEHLPLLPGAQHTVRELANVWPLALATSANRSVVEKVLAASELASCFAVTVSGEEVARGKPAPDLYLTAAAKLHVEPAKSAAVEDSSNGLRAAAAAGMVVVAIPNRSFPPDADALALADVKLPALTELSAGLLREIDR